MTQPNFSFIRFNHFKALLISFELIKREKVIESNVENTEHQIQHYCTPLQIVRKKSNNESYNEAL